MKYIAIITILFAALFSSCEKDITVSMPQYTSRVSIQCGLEVGVTPKVYFYNTVPYFDIVTLQQAFVRGANIKISNSIETDSLIIDSTYNYLKCEYEYFYHGLVPVKANENYSLTIVSNKVTYAATTKTNLSAVTIDSVGYTSKFNDVYGEHEGIIPYFHDLPNQTNFYRYEMLRSVDTTMKYREGQIHSPCIGAGSVMILELGRSVYNDQNINGGQINLVIEPAYSHKKGMIGIVKIETIDQASYDFYDQLDRQKLGQTNPFVEPVFLANGQFGNKAVGYFGCIVRSSPVQFVFPE